MLYPSFTDNNTCKIITPTSDAFVNPQVYFLLFNIQRSSNTHNILTAHNNISEINIINPTSFDHSYINNIEIKNESIKHLLKIICHTYPI